MPKSKRSAKRRKSYQKKIAKAQAWGRKQVQKGSEHDSNYIQIGSHKRV